MEVIKNRIYRHFKGDYYLVVDIAIHSETGEKLVLYRSLYGNGELYARRYEMFIELVNGKPRFELQEITSKREIYENS